MTQPVHGYGSTYPETGASGGVDDDAARIRAEMDLEWQERDGGSTGSAFDPTVYSGEETLAAAYEAHRALRAAGLVGPIGVIEEIRHFNRTER